MKGYRKVLIAVNGSLDVLKQGIKLAQDEKTWVTVLKVVPPYELVFTHNRGCMRPPENLFGAG
jgi:hypothetical protein